VALISIKRRDDEKVIELGGGDAPLFRPNVDVRPGPQTDFVADFNGPLPITSEEWDVVFAKYVVEHLSWRNVRGFLAECLRILKPGGRLVLITANTAAQLDFIRANPGGWDGRGPFESFSCVLFGDQDYDANTHRNWMDPSLVVDLLTEAGFVGVKVQPEGARRTDMAVEASRPVQAGGTAALLGHSEGAAGNPPISAPAAPIAPQGGPTGVSAPSALLSNPGAGPAFTEQNSTLSPYSPEQLYDKAYWNGGGKVGGYAREGYWDYPVHHVTARHVLARNPESVLELGAARGYVLKRIQDAGVRGTGLEVSKHCLLTRVCDPIHQADLTKPFPTDLSRVSFDLCYSVAVLEHIPEEAVPGLIREMARVSKRGLHGVDFGAHDDGFDQTHVTLKPKAWWEQQFAANAPGYPVEVLDKEELEKGDLPAEVVRGDGRRKINVGSYTTMFHHGWTNIDVHDLAGWANNYRYGYERRDATQGFDYGTGSVDCIFCSHCLEHLSYKDGLQLLKEFRRVIRPDGALRLLVPDAGLLMKLYAAAVCGREESGDGYLGIPREAPSFSDLDEISDGCTAAPTAAGKLWSLLHEGHSACYDEETLLAALKEAGFNARRSALHSCGLSGHERLKQIVRETHDSHQCLSLIVDAVPLVA
jgi:predicted SAM-dependent methyltransferase